MTAQRAALLVLLAILFAVPSMAQRSLESSDGTTSPHSDAELVSDRAAVAPGETLEVALRMTMDPGWHSYWKNAGDSGQATSIRWRLPEGVEAGDITWPYPERIDVPPFTTYGYHDEVFLFTTITVPASFKAAAISLNARADWLICADICLPAFEDVALEIPVRTGANRARSEWADAMDRARRAIPRELPQGWSASARSSGSGYSISITPASPLQFDPTGIELFAAEPAVMQHAGEQTVTTDENGFTFTVQRSEFAQGTASQFAAVLVAPTGFTFEGDARAIEINVPVEGAPLGIAEAAGGGAPLSLMLALGLAFIGGMLLNLMPCVFPIISIKILGFAEGRSHERGVLRRHGLLFGSGVMVSFWALAAGLILLRAGGESLGWGFQLQSPMIVAGLALLMFALGLNLLGVFEIGTGLSSVGGRLDRGRGPAGAFFSGVLATVVATPCTAPFMGASLGWALSQPATAAMLVFTALGLGMATPYLLLSFFPAWLERLPRPGPWMISLKQVLSFALFATAIWLIWVFGLQTGIDGATLLLIAITLVGFGAWILNRWKWATSGPRTRAVTRGFATVAFGLALVAILSGSRMAGELAPAGDGWQTFSPERVDELVLAGQPVFVDFTAAWCITCQVNKRVALHTPDVERAFLAANVTRMRADWTNRDPVITAALERFGRSGVPLYVLYPGGNAEPVLLPEILTPGRVIAELERIPQTASLP
ncbi:thioredoxin family protein [soil metagenome]